MGCLQQRAYIESGRYKKVLLIGADKMSSIVDYTDRTTCIIFGDGAGAVFLNLIEEGWVQDEYFRSDGWNEVLQNRSWRFSYPTSTRDLENRHTLISRRKNSI